MANGWTRSFRHFASGAVRRSSVVALVLATGMLGAAAQVDPARTPDTGLDDITTPTIDTVATTVVLPRLTAFATLSDRLQNVVLRRCALGAGMITDDVAGDYARAVWAASAATALAFGSELNRTAAQRVLTAFGDVTVGRTQFNVLLATLEDQPATLNALRNLEPSYVGLPALEYALFGFDDPQSWCPLAATVAANVSHTASALKLRWENGRLDPQWVDPNFELGGRRRLFDLFSGILEALRRSADVLARGGRGGAVSNMRAANLAYLQGTLQGMLDMAQLIQAAARPGTDETTQTARLVSSLNTLGELAASTARGQQSDLGPIMTEISTAMRQLRLIVLTDVVTAFGFEPAALDSNFREATPAPR